MTAQQVEFGLLASRIWCEMTSGDDDPITQAYDHDCGHLIHAAAQDRVRALLEEAGMTAREFDEELACRVSSKWAYGFGSVQDFLEPLPPRWTHGDYRYHF